MAESITPPPVDAIPLLVSRFLSSCSVVSTVIILSIAVGLNRCWRGTFSVSLRNHTFFT